VIGGRETRPRRHSVHPARIGRWVDLDEEGVQRIDPPTASVAARCGGSPRAGARCTPTSAAAPRTTVTVPEGGSFDVEVTVK
jgi:hypothetical protein